MLLLTIICTAALAPGAATAWLLHRRYGWTRAVLAGAAVTVSLPGFLLLTLLAFPPVAFLLALLAGGAALTAYDKGRISHGIALTAAALVCLWCAGWTL